MSAHFTRRVNILILFFLLLQSPAVFTQSADNISANNEKAFDAKVKELMKVEFFEIVRGRAKPKPLRVNDAANVQELIKTKDEFFQSLYAGLQDVLNLLDETFSALPSYVPEESVRPIKKTLEARAVSLVTLDEKIRNAKSFFELQRLLAYSHDNLLMFPLQLKLIKKVMTDFNRFSEGRLAKYPADYEAVMKMLVSKMAVFINDSFSSEVSFNMEKKVKEMFSFFASLEFQWTEEIASLTSAATVPFSAQDGIFTATLRTQDGLVIAYGSFDSVARATEEMKKENHVGLTAQKVEGLIRSKNIPGIISGEVFYSYDHNEAAFFQDTVRGAETSGVFPLFEGLQTPQASRLLSQFGYDVETMDECGGVGLSDVKPRLEKKLAKGLNHVAILCGTEPQSIVFSARK